MSTPKGKAIGKHCRTDSGAIETTLIDRGDLAIEPPGMTLAFAELFGTSEA